MPYQPKFAVSAQVVGELERIAVLRERISKQGAMDLLNPLLEAGLVQRSGTQKAGRYTLA